MAGRPGFSFLRLGDMELTLLLAAQEGISGQMGNDEGSANGTIPSGNPGIGLEFATRLRRAFEQASYLDSYERLWPNSELLPRLKLRCSSEQERNPDVETSFILLTWMESEFATYCRGRRIGLAGAEALLLQNLLQREGFRRAAGTFWPSDARIYFHQIRNNGRNVAANLESIKRDLRRFVEESGVDTVFLSLGGAAKILCVELAAELGVRMFDSGAMLRALTYSGSDGNRATRSTHFPFLYRVPFAVWCDAMEETWTNLAPHQRLAKVHAQLILEVQKKEVGWTHASGELDMCRQNREAFADAHRIYLERYSHLFDYGADVRRERAVFLHFCGTHGLTKEGRQFLLWFKAKSVVSQLRWWKHK
jgi:hypothetical protein